MKLNKVLEFQSARSLQLNYLIPYDCTGYSLLTILDVELTMSVSSMVKVLLSNDLERIIYELWRLS